MQQRPEIAEAKFTAFQLGYAADQVKLQDDELIVEKVAVRFASFLLGELSPSSDWPEPISAETRNDCTAIARDVLTLIDECVRLFKIKTPGAEDDGRVLRDLLGMAAPAPPQTNDL